MGIVGSLVGRLRRALAVGPDTGMRADEDGITWIDRFGEATDSVGWDDVAELHAWTRLVWLGSSSFRHEHHLDVVGTDGSTRSTYFPARSDPSLDDVLAEVPRRTPRVPFRDTRRFGMIETLRRDMRPPAH